MRTLSFLLLTACTAAEPPVGQGDPSTGDPSGDAAMPGDTVGDADPGDARASEVVHLSVTAGGRVRELDVFVPAARLAPAPLVVDWHCYGCVAAHQADASGFRELAETEGFLVAYPEGVSNSFNAGGCCGSARDLGVDDVAFARALVAEVGSRWTVDPARIYASGLSNGGAMSHRLACEASDLFAAVAPVSFPLALEPLTACQPSRPIAVFHFHGTGDTAVPFDGTGTFTSTTVADSFAYWGAVNGCDATPEVSWQQGASSCERLPGCDAGVEVVLCSIAGSHVLYQNDDDVDIAARAWSYLSQQSLL